MEELREKLINAMTPSCRAIYDSVISDERAQATVARDGPLPDWSGGEIDIASLSIDVENEYVRSSKDDGKWHGLLIKIDGMCNSQLIVTDAYSISEKMWWEGQMDGISREVFKSGKMSKNYYTNGQHLREECFAPDGSEIEFEAFGNLPAV